MLGTAIAITAEAFKDKKDMGGKPYILHCLFVMDSVKTQSIPVRIAAVMHDLLEDTEWTSDQLRKVGIPEKSILLIEILTHNPADSYENYIKKVSLHPEATLIKMGDLEHNSTVLRLKGIRDKDLQRITKYHKAYHYLKYS